MTKKIEETQVVEALKQVVDPELRIDVHTLGLIYKIEIKEPNVKITMTLTTPLCPYGPMVIEDVKQKIKKIAKAKSVAVELTFEPLWTPPDDLRAMLGM